MGYIFECAKKPHVLKDSFSVSLTEDYLPVHIHDFSDSALNNMFDHMSLQNWLTMSLVCNRWRRLLNSRLTKIEQLYVGSPKMLVHNWNRCQKYFIVHSNELKRIEMLNFLLKRCSRFLGQLHIHSLNLLNIKTKSSEFLKAIKEAIHLMSKNCFLLNKLTFGKDVKIPSEIYKYIFKHLGQQLEVLVAPFATVNSIFQHFNPNNLRELAINVSSMEDIHILNKWFPRIQSLSFETIKLSFIKCLDQWTNLTELSVSTLTKPNSFFEELAKYSLAKRLQCLTILSYEGRATCLEPAEQLTALRSLSINVMHKKVIREIVDCLPDLQHLTLDLLVEYSPNIGYEFLDLGRLQNLKSLSIKWFNSSLNKLNLNQMKPIASLTCLELIFIKCDSKQDHNLGKMLMQPLSQLFPNITNLHLNNQFLDFVIVLCILKPMTQLQNFYFGTTKECMTCSVDEDLIAKHCEERFIHYHKYLHYLMNIRQD